MSAPQLHTHPSQAASNIHTVSTSCQQHSHSLHSLHKLPATFTQPPQAASNIHTVSTSSQQHSHSLHKQPATFTQSPQAASNIHTASQKSHTLVAIRSQPVIHITSQKSSAQFSVRLTLPKPLHGLSFWFSRGEGGVGGRKEKSADILSNTKNEDGLTGVPDQRYTPPQSNKANSPHLLYTWSIYLRDPDSFFPSRTFLLRRFDSEQMERQRRALRGISGIMRNSSHSSQRGLVDSTILLLWGSHSASVPW